MGEPPQRHVRRGARESFSARQFNRRETQALDIARVTDRSHCNPIVNLEKFLPRTAADGEKQDAVAIADGRDRTSLRELHLDVLAPVRDRFYPSVRFFDHPT